MTNGERFTLGLVAISSAIQLLPVHTGTPIANFAGLAFWLALVGCGSTMCGSSLAQMLRKLSLPTPF